MGQKKWMGQRAQERIKEAAATIAGKSEGMKDYLWDRITHSIRTRRSYSHAQLESKALEEWTEANAAKGIPTGRKARKKIARMHHG